MNDQWTSAIAAWTVVVGIVAGYLIRRAYYTTRGRLRRLRATAVKGAPDAAQVKIAGRIVAWAPPLVAPISGRPCVHYAVTVQEKSARGGWKPFVEEARTSPFLVDDGTGRALFRATRAKVDITAADARVAGTFRDSSQELAALLGRHGRDPNLLGGLLARHLRWDERILQPGARVAVQGTTAWETAPGAPASGDARQLLQLVVTDPDNGPALVSDHPSTLL